MPTTISAIRWSCRRSTASAPAPSSAAGGSASDPVAAQDAGDLAREAGQHRLRRDTCHPGEHDPPAICARWCAHHHRRQRHMLAVLRHAAYKRCMANGGWKILAVLAAAQFLMVLDQAVMNVSISQLVEDFDTDVTTIQARHHALLAGDGGADDRRAASSATSSAAGARSRSASSIYGVGSLLTAVSWSVPVLTLGWSVLEGIGAALVLPALAALTARSFEGKRARAGLRRPRRRGGRRHRGRPDPGRLGHHQPDLAAGVRRRGAWS